MFTVDLISSPPVFLCPFFHVGRVAVVLFLFLGTVVWFRQLAMSMNAVRGSMCNQMAIALNAMLILYVLRLFRQVLLKNYGH